MNNITVDSTWNFNQKTDRDGLQGIYSKKFGESNCSTYHLVAIALDGSIIAHSSWSTSGDAYREGEREFGNQLEKALGARLGY